jgi:hypothetical protein
LFVILPVEKLGCICIYNLVKHDQFSGGDDSIEEKNVERINKNTFAIFNYLNFVILEQRMIKSRLLIYIHTIELTNIT